MRANLLSKVTPRWTQSPLGIGRTGRQVEVVAVAGVDAQPGRAAGDPERVDEATGRLGPPRDDETVAVHVAAEADPEADAPGHLDGVEAGGRAHPQRGGRAPGEPQRRPEAPVDPGPPQVEPLQRADVQVARGILGDAASPCPRRAAGKGRCRSRATSPRARPCRRTPARGGRRRGRGLASRCGEVPGGDVVRRRHVGRRWGVGRAPAPPARCPPRLPRRAAAAGCGGQRRRRRGGGARLRPAAAGAGHDVGALIGLEAIEIPAAIDRDGRGAGHGDERDLCSSRRRLRALVAKLVMFRPPGCVMKSGTKNRAVPQP